MSHDALNRTVASLGRGIVTVVPLTSNVAVLRPFQVLVPVRHLSEGDAHLVAALERAEVWTHPWLVDMTSDRRRPPASPAELRSVAGIEAPVGS